MQVLVWVALFHVYKNVRVLVKTGGLNIFFIKTNKTIIVKTY